ncbi:glutathione S-transferase family protein [Marinobacter sp.]|uniref:glutathione S-transferase family protein n=1 Tax=Marinobacter sp. TaxID=50741 RepID=UPI00199E617D|nr:glutathione S-transferase family protein [Marinobacter sp.]MBD3658095.1 glutathione S-transferase [Marinobacter sp.]
MAIRLYQFAISHYSEKVRWALDFKGLSYQAVNLLPGQHVATIRKVTRSKHTSVPVLDHDGEIVQGSAAILDYLDASFPDQPLIPPDPDLQNQVLAWQQRLDDAAGPAVRTYCYHYLLQRPKAVIPMLTAGTPFYNRFLLGLLFSKVDETMRNWMKINAKTAESARQTIDHLLTELAEVYQRQPYLVGDRFSRADLTAAALLAPIFQPPQYPVPWPRPARLPAELRTQLADWETRSEGLVRLYHDHR